MCLGWLSDITVIFLTSIEPVTLDLIILRYIFFPQLKPCCQNDYYDVRLSETIIIVFMSENAAFSENTCDVKAF